MASRRLREQGIEDAGLDARRLVEAATGLDAAQVVANPQHLVSERSRSELEQMLTRRIAREPVSRILGRRGFFGREFMVAAGTLDPRPETETLVEAVLGLADEEGWRRRPVRLIDIGTGTGCILLTLLAELASAAGVGTDISPAAIEVARENAQRLGLSQRVRWHACDLVDGIAGPFDILVSNPPYIASAEIAGLDAEVRRWDPLIALDGGPDGLAFYRRLAAEAPRVVPCGWVVLEVGAGQADAVSELLSSLNGAGPVRIYKDMAGHRRCVARRLQG